MVCVNDFIGRESRDARGWRNLYDGKVPFPLSSPDATSAARLGCRSASGGNPENTAVFGPVPSARRRRTDHFLRYRGRSRDAMKVYQAGILAEYVPYTHITAQNLKKLADLKPKTLAVMHGSSFTGNCASALSDMNVARSALPLNNQETGEEVRSIIGIGKERRYLLPDEEESVLPAVEPSPEVEGGEHHLSTFEQTGVAGDDDLAAGSGTPIPSLTQRKPITAWSPRKVNSTLRRGCWTKTTIRSACIFGKWAPYRC